MILTDILIFSVGVLVGGGLFWVITALRDHRVRKKRSGYYQALLEAIPDMVFIMTQEGTYVDYIPAEGERPILPPEEFLGKNIQEIMPPDVAQQHITSIQAAIQSNQSDLIEYSLQPEGENRHYEMRIVPLEDQRALCVVRDVTLQKQLFDSVTARANELNTLHAIALDIARRQDLEELLKITIERAVRLLEGNAGCVYLWDEEHQILDERVKYGGPKEDGEKLLREIEKNALRVVEEGQTILERNISPAIEESNILISAPLLWDQQVIGVINVCGEEESWPDLEQESILLEKLSSMVAIAVQNAQLLSGLEKQLTLSQTLQEMGALLTSRSSLHDVLEEVLNLLERVIKFDSVSIHLLKEGVLQISVSRGFEDQAHLEDLLTERTEDILTERLIKEKYFYIPDTRRSEDWVMFQETLKIRSWMGAILEVRGKVIGVLNVDSYTVNAYNEETAQTVKAFADQAAVAIENARLSSAERREHQRLKTLYTLNQRLSVSLDKDEIIHQTLDLVHAEFEAAVADFFLYDPEKNDLQLAETLGRSPKEEEILLASLDRLSQKSVLSHVLTDLKPTHIEDTSQQEAWLNINQLDDDIRSVITVPVFTQEQLGGALSVMHTEVGRYSSEDVDLMQTIAQQVSLALNNATKYKRVQNLLENLKQEELIQRNLLEHLPLGILLLDANYRIVSSNTNGEDLLQELVPDFEGGEISSLGDISLNQLVMYCDDPNPFEAHSVSHPNKIYEAQIRRVSTSEEKQWLLLIQDVTEMRKSQRQYHLQERLATIGRFAAGIAHDFNNIMSAITVYVDVLNRTLDLPAKSQEHLEIIKNQSMRANELIRQILDFSRQTDLEPLPLDCLALLREVLQILERVFPSDIEIHFEHEEDRSYAVKGDPGRLQQVIMNIAGNARDAMPEGGELFIRLSHLSIQQDEVPPLRLMPSGEWVQIEIEDTGEGIPPERQQKIFEPFYSTKQKGEGTGLGLAQVYGIVKNHQGFINVESDLGEGSTFTIYLPASKTPLPKEQMQEEVQDIHGAGKLALLVEDDQIIREALWTILEEYDFQIITASNGTQALNILEQVGEQISFVITDIVMPKMNGIHLYKAAQDMGLKKEFLFITGHPLTKDRQNFLEKSDVRWLKKPFSMNDFLQVLQDIL